LTKGDITQDYELQREIGSGAYGIVYEAVQKVTGILSPPSSSSINFEQ